MQFIKPYILITSISLCVISNSNKIKWDIENQSLLRLWDCENPPRGHDLRCVTVNFGPDVEFHDTTRIYNNELFICKLRNTIPFYLNLFKCCRHGWNSAVTFKKAPRALHIVQVKKSAKDNFFNELI